MRWLGLLELATFAACGFAAALSLASAALWPLVRRSLARLHPANAARRVWWLAAAPSLGPPLALAACFLPALVGADHCVQHGEHVHLCLRHPALALGGAAGAACGLLAGGFGVALAAHVTRLVRALRAGERIAAGAGGALAPDARLLALEQPLSLALGVLRPRILVSEGLARALAPAALAVVLEHERAHARRRDVLFLLLARVLSWPHLPRLRRELLAALALANERACDEAAAERTGDRLLVAETLLGVARLAARSPLACAASFADGAVPARVEGLLAEPPRPLDPRRARLFALASLATLAPLVEPLHHAVEHLLGALLRVL